MTTDPPPPPEPLAAPAGPRRGDVVLAFLGALLLLSAFAGVRELWDADEGRYGTVALDMLRAGDLVTPRENGLRFMDKPPLVYWVAAGAYEALGPTPFAARLPCLLAGAALSTFAFLFAAAWTGSRRTAFLAAFVLATSGAGMGFSRTVTMDMPLSAAVAGALYAGWRALDAPSWRPRAGLGLALGLGLLAKGPLAVVATAVVACAWGLAGAPWRRLLGVALSPLAWLVAIAVAAPWYALCERANPGYLEHFVVYEHFRRFREPGHREFSPVWLYGVTLPLLLLPWSHLVVRARLAKPTAGDAEPPRATTRFAWAWTLSLLVFYSAGRNRLFTYILPAFLPLAVLAAARLSETLWGDERRARALARWATGYGLLAVVGGALLASRLPFTAELSIGGRDVLPFAEDRLAAIGVPILVGGLPLTLAPLAFRFARGPRARAVVLVLAAACVFYGLDLGAARVDRLRSPRALAETLVRERGPSDRVVCLDLLPQGLRFYGDLHVAVAGKQPEIVEPWATKDGAGVLLPLEDLDRLWAGPGRVLLVAREKKAAPWNERGGRVLATGLSGAQRADLVVLENRPRGP